MLNDLNEIAPANIQTGALLAAKSHQVYESGVKVHLDTSVETVGGVVGNFRATLSDGSGYDVGALVVATGSIPYQPEEFDYGQDPR